MKKGKGTFILTHREQEEILAKRRMAKLPKVIFVCFGSNPKWDKPDD